MSTVDERNAATSRAQVASILADEREPSTLYWEQRGWEGTASSGIHLFTWTGEAVPLRVTRWNVFGAKGNRLVSGNAVDTRGRRWSLRGGFDNGTYVHAKPMK